MMKLGCINTAWFGSTIDYFEGIRLIKEIGFDTIDIFPLHNFKSYELKRIKKMCDSLCLPIGCVVTAYPEMITLEEHVRRYAIDSYKRLIDTGVYLDAPNALIVLGEYIWEKNVVKPEVQWGYAVAGVKELAEYAAKCDMNVLIELEPFQYSLVNDIDTMEKFLLEVNMPNCLANVDIGHLHVQHIAPEEIKRLQSRIGGVHLSDNDRTVHNDWPPGRGNANLIGYFQMLEACGYNDIVSIELEFAPDPNIIIEWVTEAYTATDKLMEYLQLRTK